MLANKVLKEQLERFPTECRKLSGKYLGFGFGFGFTAV